MGQRRLAYSFNLKSKFVFLAILIFFFISIVKVWYSDIGIIGLDFWLTIFGFHFQFVLDGVNIGLIILTILISTICLVSGFDTELQNNFLYNLVIFVLGVFLVFAFLAADIFFFYIMFEAVLIPIFLLVGYWGSRPRKIKAAYYLLFFTAVGSIFFLIAILILFKIFGTTNFNFLFLYSSFLPIGLQKVIWVFVFVTLLVKIPAVPFHIWLPEAHVEAPTAGSIILAALLLKLGTFGVLKYNVLILPEISEYYSIYVYMIAIIGVIYASLMTLRQVDLKRIIAYSSIAHINVVLVGLFSFSLTGVTGSILLIIAHGIVSSALFFLVGILYERYHSRLTLTYGGLAIVIPIFSSFLFVFILSNCSLPLTSNFIGELLVIIGLAKVNFLLTVIIAVSTFLTVIYSMWLFNKLCFGTLNLNFIKVFKDVNRIELLILGLFLIWNIGIGCYPLVLLNLCEGTLIYYCTWA